MIKSILRDKIAKFGKNSEENVKRYIFYYKMIQNC